MRTEAIVIKKKLIREYDELVICYTRDAGKQVYHAKSIARSTSKQGSHLDILNHVDFSTIEASAYPIIASAYSFNSFRHLKQSLPALATAFFLLECFDKLVFDSQADEALWQYLRGELESYDVFAREGTTDWRMVQKASHDRLLEVMGHHVDTSIVDLAQSHFKSLQFFRDVTL